MSNRSPSAKRCGSSKNTQVPLRLPRSRTTSWSSSQEILACSGDKNGSSGNRMSPSRRPMVVSIVLRSKRCPAVPASSSSVSAMRKSVRAAGLPAVRTSGLHSPSGAPQVGQNFVPGCTAEPQREQAGPEPGAVSRRPQLGQNGSRPLVGPPQNGHVPTSAREGGSGGGGDGGDEAGAAPATCVAGMLEGGRGGAAGESPPPPPPPPPRPPPPPPHSHPAAAPPPP